MPPIFGIFNTGLHGPDPEMIRRMNAAAVYVKPRTIRSFELPGLHVASALRSGHQQADPNPAVCRLGYFVIVADACLYNRDELIHRLDQDAPAGKASDDALILAGYRRWGPECMHYLEGDFAFAVFNTHTGDVFCARDPIGVRPFFYSMQDQNFIFGSELRYVLGSFEEQPEISEDYLLDTLVTTKTARDLTAYDHIRRLAPGCFLSVSHGNSSITSYWKPDLEKVIRMRNEEDYVQLFRQELFRSVNVRCKGSVTLGVELSGGLDSSAVTGIAADLMVEEKIPLYAFSNIFPADTGMAFTDEQEFIHAVRAFKNINWVGIDRVQQGIPDLFRETIKMQGCFIQQNFSIFNRGVYEAAGDRDVDVLLSGFGGDELVSARIAMPWDELISGRQWKTIADELYYKGVTLKSLLKPVLLAGRYLYRRLMRPVARSRIFTPELLRRRFVNLPLKPAFVAAHDLENRHRQKYGDPVAETTALRQQARIGLDHIPQRMEYCYAAAAQYGLEYRYPLLDTRLMEIILAFPPWVKQHHGINRYGFREAIKGFVPESVRIRDDKSGSTIPHALYSLASEKESILELVKECSGSEYLNNIFEFSRFSGWYEKLVKRDKPEMNYMMPGAFYAYLMVMIYHNRDKGQGTRDK
jgi:asparagine synthase (glutamine-hydrolysing)